MDESIATHIANTLSRIEDIFGRMEAQGERQTRAMEVIAAFAPYQAWEQRPNDYQVIRDIVTSENPLEVAVKVFGG